MDPEQLTEEANVRLKAILPAFDLGGIFAIIQAVMSLLSSCGGIGGAAVKRQADNPGALARIRMRQALQREGFRARSRELDDAERAAWKLAQDATQEELEAFLDVSNEG